MDSRFFKLNIGVSDVLFDLCGHLHLPRLYLFVTRPARRRRRIKDLSEAMSYQNDFYPTPSRSSRSMWGLVLSSVFDGRGAHILCRARRYFFDWAADLVVTSITPAAPCTP